jgi:hypothetical protein
MIRRDVIENPNVIETMDLFNDGKDTLNWLKGKNISNQFSELINRLNEKITSYQLGFSLKSTLQVVSDEQ